MSEQQEAVFNAKFGDKWGLEAGNLPVHSASVYPFEVLGDDSQKFLPQRGKIILDDPLESKFDFFHHKYLLQFINKIKNSLNFVHSYQFVIKITDASIEKCSLREIRINKNTQNCIEYL